MNFDQLREQFPIEDVVGRYLTLVKRKALCPFHNDGHPSFEVVPGKRRAFCNACKWNGDVVDFVAEYTGVTLIEAAKLLTGDSLPAAVERPPSEPESDPAEWTPIVPAPASAPELDTTRVYNPKRGRTVNLRPTRVDAYLTADGQRNGYVLRLDFPDGGKVTPTVTWCRHADGRELWAMRPFPRPAPLQGLDDLAARPTAPVLIVSGEKTRAAAAARITGMVAVTWAGGDGAVKFADWTPLAGRDCVIWPDADESCRNAADAIAARIPSPLRLRIIDTAGLPDGFDAADLPAGESMAAWCKARVVPYVAHEKPPLARESAASPGEETSATPVGVEVDITVPVEQDATSSVRDAEQTQQVVPMPIGEGEFNLSAWTELGLSLNGKKVADCNLHNACKLIEVHPDLAGQVWHDTFLGRTLTTWNSRDGEPREWEDADDATLCLWMQRAIGLKAMGIRTVQSAAQVYAMAHRRNECREWLTSLTWDGIERLPAFLPLAFGCEANAYTEAVGRCWLVSMVARVMRPGCKVDTMPVFEGLQGAGKSSALQTLVGSRWFAEAHESVQHKDFFQNLQGKLLLEIGEMDSFSRGEVAAVKRVITCQSDRYRASFGRHAADHPRQGVFAGTTNKDDWNRDETGARRFWPITCHAIDLPWIRRWREQLFAEALARLTRGEGWWDVPAADAKREQEARRQVDAWEEVIDAYLVGRTETTVAAILGEAFKMDEEAWGKAEQMRVASALTTLGWKKSVAWRGGRNKKIWSKLDAG